MSKRSKACDISQKAKEKVWERDNHRCILCGSKYAMPNAHFIGRAQGGLGIEQNIVTLCMKCHNDYDNGNKREEYSYKIEWYLKEMYGESWNKEKLYYNKYSN